MAGDTPTTPVRLRRREQQSLYLFGLAVFCKKFSKAMFRHCDLEKRLNTNHSNLDINKSATPPQSRRLCIRASRPDVYNTG